jgi:transcription elongation factor GreA
MENVDTDEMKTYTLVGPYESDPENGFLSIAAPIGKAMLGLREGEAFLLKQSGVEEEFRIVSIE